MLARFDAQEWQRRGAIALDPYASRVPLLTQCGWGPEHVWVLDLATGQGACFRPGGHAGADLEKRAGLWVCPLYRVVLAWFYQHKECWGLDELPECITLTDKESDALARSTRPPRRPVSSGPPEIEIGMGPEHAPSTEAT